VKPGPTARAALVLLAFLAVFTVVDRMSAADRTRRTVAAPPASEAQPDTSSAPTTTTVAPATTRAPTTTALGSYSASRVYYTAGHQADAEAFRDRFPAFSRVEPAPANLSDRVALHAVIGEDYPGV
jgi:hypothetical protein